MNQSHIYRHTEGGREGEKEREQEESFGDDRYVCDLHCGDDFTDRYLSANSSR